MTPQLAHCKRCTFETVFIGADGLCDECRDFINDPELKPKLTSENYSKSARERWKSYREGMSTKRRDGSRVTLPPQ